MSEHPCRILEVTDRPGVGVLSLDGPIDARNVAAVEAALAPSGVRTVVLDLQRVRYINSAGMSFLVRLSDRLEAEGGGLRLAQAQPKVKVVLEMMGLTAFLKLHATVEGALRAFRERTRPLRRGSPA